MFCDACGTQLQVNQRFCSGCGKTVAGPVIPGYPQRSRIQEHVRLLAILWFAFSALEVLGGFILGFVANTIFVHIVRDAPAPGPPIAFLRGLLSMIAIFILAKAAVGFLAGYGLLTREPWARVLTLVLGFLALIHVPLGTALGVYTLWVLLPAKAEEEYEKYRMAQASAA